MPVPRQPDVPAVAWGKIESIADIRRAVAEVFALHEAAEINADGLNFLLGVLERAAKLFETIDIAPAVRELQEQLAAMRP
jgi:hypothetical protein